MDFSITYKNEYGAKGVKKKAKGAGPCIYSLLIGRFLQLTTHLHSHMVCQFLQASRNILGL